MKPKVVVDVGNTRIKWGRCAADRVTEMASLPHDDDAAWRKQFVDWQIAPASQWAICSVRPGQREKLRDWLRRQDQQVIVVESHRQVPVHVDVDHPEKVGLDRLLNATAFNAVRPPDTAGIIVDAGTAVTVDYVDVAGTFRGGAIFPGRRLMAKALHDHTALLPLLDSFVRAPGPARSTESAMGTGITEAILGGIEKLIERFREQTMGPCDVVFTGGDASALAGFMTLPVRLWREMTLEGIRLSV